MGIYLREQIINNKLNNAFYKYKNQQFQSLQYLQGHQQFQFHLQFFIQFIIIHIKKIHQQPKKGQQQIMKTKKKPIQTKSSNAIKSTTHKTTLDEQIITQQIKEKTFATIEQNLRTLQNLHTNENGRNSLKARLSLQRKSHDERMQAHNLSPFSDRSSFSPKYKYKKTPQKLVSPTNQKEIKFVLNLKQLDKKKAKSKPASARQLRQPTLQSHNTKKTGTNNMKSVANSSNSHNQQIRKKPFPKKKQLKQYKNQKQEKAHIEFQNQFLSMMNNKMQRQKITEISDEDLECSLKRKPKQLEIVLNTTEGNNSSRSRKVDSQGGKIRENKTQIIKTMKLKIMRGIDRDYPNLDYEQKKVMAAIIIIQRLWRQRKVKMIFQHYLTPRNSIPNPPLKTHFQQASNSNLSTINLLHNHIISNKPDTAHPCQVTSKKKNLNQKQPLQQQNNFLIRQKSSQSVKQQNTSIANNRIQTPISLPFENQSQKIISQDKISQLDRPSMIKFVSCYREVKLNKNRTKSKSRRDNIFSLKESLSQMCLMQRYYQRIFPDRPQKDKAKHYELFSFNSNHSSLGNESLKMNQQSSIELFKDINKCNLDYVSPQKVNEKKQNNFQHQKQQQVISEHQQEEVWIRSETKYNYETDNDEFIVRDDHHILNKKESFTPNKETLVVDQIQDNLTIFAKNDHNNAHQLSENQESEQAPKKDTFMARNKFNQNQQLSGSQLYHEKHQPQQVKSVEKINVVATPLTPQYSLKTIQHTSDRIMAELMDEFFKEYMSFQEKQCLVKKRRSKNEVQKPKKPKIPGISITPQSISQYLDILIPYILDNDRQQILRSLQLFHPITYQRCHRVQSIIYEVFEFGEEEEDEIYWNIISNEGFFSCLERFWQENVILTKDDEKFTNFIDLTYKVYNRCITDAFSQLFNKLVLQRVGYPWHGLKRSKDGLVFDKETKTVVKEQLIEKITEQVKGKLLKQSFCYSNTEGKLVKRQSKRPNAKSREFDFNEPQQELQIIMQKLSEEDFGRVMKIANDEFLEDQNDLVFCVDERYELWADLGEVLLNELIGELQMEIQGIQKGRQPLERQLTKSQNQEFLETNETLETNYLQ